MPKDDDISFGPDFMNDEDLPIFQKSKEEEEYKAKLAQEKAKLSEKLDKEKENKANNETDKNFVQLLQMLLQQCYIFLGAIENPATGTPTPNPEQARFQIESITSLYKKTEGNLSEEEEQFFKQAMSELQMLFTQLSGGGMGGMPVPTPETENLPPQ